MTHHETSRIVNELFHSWYASLVRYACRHTGGVAMAEDLVQEVFLELCRHLRSGKPISSPKGWTLKVLRHRISKSSFYADKDRGLVFESIEHLDAERHPNLWLEPNFERSVQMAEVTRLFSRLSAREEEVVLLRLEGMKYREIGEHLGISPKSADTLFARAFHKLCEGMNQRQRKHVEPEPAAGLAARALVAKAL
jgi:RNA polymerase sigma-70 factor (ECF subfamily)